MNLRISHFWRITKLMELTILQFKSPPFVSYESMYLFLPFLTVFFFLQNICNITASPIFQADFGIMSPNINFLESAKLKIKITKLKLITKIKT